MKNRGYSLIEMILTVALLAIFLSIAVMNITAIYGFDVKETADDVDTMLAKCKVSAMSRAGDVYIELSKDEKGCHVKYYENDELVSDDIVGKKRVSMSYFNGVMTVDIDEGDSLFLAFERTTGALSSIEKAIHLFDDSRSPVGTTYCYKITFATAQKEKNIIIIPETGAHYIE